MTSADPPAIAFTDVSVELWALLCHGAVLFTPLLRLSGQVAQIKQISRVKGSNDQRALG